MLEIKKVVVIGATGAVGKTVSGIFASFGNAKVYMVGRDTNKLSEAKHEAALSVRSLTVMDNLVTKSLDELKECLIDADLVFESVSENIQLKREVHTQVNEYVGEKTIISSGTSCLSIDDLADCYDDSKKANFIGIHFFNPPYSLPLCELIPSKYNENDNKFIDDLKEYLDKVLQRDTIVVKNEPAFLANRIGFMFMNEALQYAEKYKEYGGIDYIDSILGCYTGRNMKPIETIDFVGLDIHKSIVDNVRLNSKSNDNDSFILPEFINDIISKGNLGIKTESGLYKIVDNKRMVYDIKTKKYRDVIKYNFYYQENLINDLSSGKYMEAVDNIKDDPSLESDICMIFLLKYIVYSIKISRELCNDISYCDDAMADGFNWLPPLAMIDLFGGIKEVSRLCKKYLKDDYKELLSDLPKSKYDFRRFLKAKV